MRGCRGRHCRLRSCDTMSQCNFLLRMILGNVAWNPLELLGFWGASSVGAVVKKKKELKRPYVLLVGAGSASARRGVH